MSVYNLLEYNSNYSDTTGSLWFPSKDKGDHFGKAVVNTNAFKFFRYNTKLIGSTSSTNGTLEDATSTVKLKYITSFCRSLQMPLINCKVELKLR